MQAQAVVPRTRGDGRRALILLICGALMLVLGIVGLFSLQGKAVRFDAAYDSHGDLSPFFFGQLEEGQGYSFLQNLWLGAVRYRLWVILAGLALIVAYVALNRDLLYSQSVAPYVFVLPFIITFLVFFLYPFISTVMMSFQEITGAGTKWIGFKNYQDLFANKNF